MYAASRSASGDVVGRDVQQRAGLARIGRQQPRAQLEVVRVHVRLLRKRDVRRLEIRAFDDPDRRAERDQRFDVLFGAIEICLQRDADAAPFARASAGTASIVRSTYGDLSMSIQTKLLRSSARAIRRSRLRSHSARSRSRPSCVGLTEICASRPGRRDPIEHVEVMQRDLLGFLDAREVLAELRQDRRDALRLQLLRRAHRVVDLLPGMKRDTDRRTKAVLVARSRSHGFVEPASRTLRIRTWVFRVPVRWFRLPVGTGHGCIGASRLRFVSMPPSTCTVAPVMYDAASESRNAPTRPNSSASP